MFSLMRKAIDLEYSNHPLSILSAFQRDSLPGMIYVEARSAKQVSDAINGLVGVFPSRGITLVPIEEMASLLQIKQQELTVTPGSWVRIKRGKHNGDLDKAAAELLEAEMGSAAPQDIFADLPQLEPLDAPGPGPRTPPRKSNPQPFFLMSEEGREALG